MNTVSAKKRHTVKTKVQKKVGETSYINPKTQELEVFDVFQNSKETDFNFHKVWVKDLVELLELIGGKKVKVFNHLLLKMNSDNIFIGTIRAIAEKLKLSKETVSSSLKLLKDAGHIKMLQDGVYMINPDLILKGNSAKRQKLRADYFGLKYENSNNKNKVSKEEADFINMKRAYEEQDLHKKRNEVMFQEMDEYFKGSNLKEEEKIG